MATRICIGPVSSSRQRVTIELGKTPVESFVHFDGVEQGCVAAFALGTDVGDDATDAVIEVVKTPTREPSADFLEYMSRCGFVVITREVGR